MCVCVCVCVCDGVGEERERRGRDGMVRIFILVIVKRSLLAGLTGSGTLILQVKLTIGHSQKIVHAT